MIRRFERLRDNDRGTEMISVSGSFPEIPPKRQEGERAGATPKITNNQVWPPTEPPLAEGIRKREEVVKWV